MMTSSKVYSKWIKRNVWKIQINFNDFFIITFVQFSLKYLFQKFLIYRSDPPQGAGKTDILSARWNWVYERCIVELYEPSLLLNYRTTLNNSELWGQRSSKRNVDGYRLLSIKGLNSNGTALSVFSRTSLWVPNCLRKNALKLYKLFK